MPDTGPMVTGRPGDTEFGYYYPEDLARFVRDRWRDNPAPSGDPDSLPDTATLGSFFSACYQASLLREEERQVVFRAILAEPELFNPGERPPEGLRRLLFSDPPPFEPVELRRLSVAADPQRTLIGVCRDAEGFLRIWGLINSGTRWLRELRGGRRAGTSLPPVPVAHVDAPGSIEAYKGHEILGKLRVGALTGSRVDPFESRWLPDQFSGLLEGLVERHQASRSRARELSGEIWAPLEPGLPHRITQRMMKRVISVLREAHHGGTVIFLPSEESTDPSSGPPYVDLGYRFAVDERARLFFPDLIVDILGRLARIYGTASHEREPASVGWEEFEATTDTQIAALDEALFETAHMIAGLAATDGAVVMSKQNELLGFGGMVSGRLPAIESVDRALDLEGEEVVGEGTANMGARHNSAYRLVGALPGSTAVVISQDGGVRWALGKGGRVTCWEQE